MDEHDDGAECLSKRCAILEPSSDANDAGSRGAGRRHTTMAEEFSGLTVRGAPQGVKPGSAQGPIGGWATPPTNYQTRQPPTVGDEPLAAGTTRRWLARTVRDIMWKTL